MPRFMKTLNNISRSQAVFRNGRLQCEDLYPAHHSFILLICRKPGSSQEELSRELCLNKSTVTRALVHLEKNGYVRREQSAEDKRQFAVYPTQKMLDVLPRVREITRVWNEEISEGISEEELNVFLSVLARMETRAREMIANQEER